MAGVGFELKKLFTARTAAGHIKAYSYSAIITAGPFALMTSMVLGIQLWYSYLQLPSAITQIFTATVVYAFVFSQILTSGFTMVITRYVADSLAIGRYQDMMASLFGISAVFTVIGSITAGIFFYDKPLPLTTKILAYLFLIQLMLTWAQSVYLSAIKRYERLLFSYAAGVVTSIGLAGFFLAYTAISPEQAGLLAIDIGMALIVLLFFLNIVAYYGMGKTGMNFAFLVYFERHWRLFFISASYTLGLFLPNILIWLGPWGVTVADTFRYAPVYDVLTFYAFLSILPLMMLFVVSVETNFYERYAVYFSYITGKGSFRAIDDARKDLLHTLWFELRHIVEFQLVFTLIALALGNYALSWSGITYDQVNMYNILLLAAFFTGLLQLIYILLIYFDCQKEVLKISLIYFGGNLVLGFIGLKYVGPASYGFTFFIVAAISFLTGFVKLSNFGKRINYYVFCSQPVFYNPVQGFLTRLVKKIYKDRYVDLEQARGDK